MTMKAKAATLLDEARDIPLLWYLGATGGGLAVGFLGSVIWSLRYVAGS